MIGATPRAFLLALLAIVLSSVPGCTLWAGLGGLALLALTLADGFLLQPGLLSVERHLDGHLPLDQWCEVTLSLLNRGHSPLLVRVTDSPPDAFQCEPDPIESTVSIAPRSTGLVRYNVRAERRGAYRFDAIFLRLQGALGLAWRQTVQPAAQEVHVYPNFGDVKRFELLEHQLRAGMFGNRAMRLPGEGSDFDTLRDYLPDDDVRWIDWNATARSSHPITRTYQMEKNQTLYVLLDAGRLTASRVDDCLTKLDYSLNATVILAYMALRQGDRVGVTAFADRLLTSVAARAGKAQLSSLLKALYDIQPHFSESNFEAAITWLRTHQRRRALVVIFTDFQDLTAARRFLGHVALLRPTHLPMVVALRDERLLQVAARVPDSVSALYQVGIASELLLEREQIIGQLRHLGAIVVEADAQHIAMDTVRKYLETKLKNRL
ncbi:MAG: DUF58 domain-containing protein [Candidatus Xenobia bacterium]